MSKPTAAQKKAFEKKVGAIAASIASIVDEVKRVGIGMDGVNATFAHFQRTLQTTQQAAIIAANTNDASNFSLDSPAPAGLVPAAVFEGRYAGHGTTTPHTPQDPATPVEHDNDGTGMMMA